MSALPAGAAVLPDAEAAARDAAERVVGACAAGGERIALCLSGGSTPRRLYEILATPEINPRIDWTRVHVFWGDERFVAATAHESNEGMARAALLDHVPIPPANIHPIPRDGSPEDSARDYEARLKVWYGASELDPGRPLFDCMLLGIGPDGHTASLFPGKPEVEVRGRWAVGVPEPGLPPPVPRVSLTFEALSSSRTILFVVTGANKREALGRIATGEPLPAGRVKGVGETIWLLDAEAGA